jgi:hypothetical protein
MLFMFHQQISALVLYFKAQQTIALLFHPSASLVHLKVFFPMDQLELYNQDEEKKA